VLIDLVDVLRCPMPHDEMWLVAAADRTEGRQIVDGTLGCPICQAEFPVQGGVADFSGGTALRASLERTSEEAAWRIAALLDLTPGPGFALLFGTWGSHAGMLGSLSPVPLLLVNPPTGVQPPDVSVILVGNVLPLASGTARAAAIDPTVNVPSSIAIGAVRSHGRILGLGSMPLPPNVTELARDPSGWVAERDVAGSAPIGLSLRSR